MFNTATRIPQASFIMDALFHRSLIDLSPISAKPLHSAGLLSCRSWGPGGSAGESWTEGSEEIAATAQTFPKHLAVCSIACQSAMGLVEKWTNMDKLNVAC